MSRWDDIKDSIINENEFNHCEEIYFTTLDWILFDIHTLHDSNEGVVFAGITYKEVFECINLIEANRDKFNGIKVSIYHEKEYLLEDMRSLLL